MPIGSLQFPCTDTWTAADSSNNFDCGNILSEFILKPEFITSVVPAAIGILILIPISCCLMLGRYCCNCCGSSRLRPSSLCGGTCSDDADPDEELSDAVKASMYSDTCIWIVRGMCLILVALAAVGVALNVTGGAKISSGITDINPTLDRIVEWAIGLLASIKKGVADPADPTKFPEGFDASMFDSVETQMRDYQKDAKKAVDDFSGYITSAATIIGYVSFAPGVVMVLPTLAALCCIRRVLPCIFIIFSFFFQFIYFFFSTICVILVIVFTLIYDDLSTTEPTQKSILQWYIIPQCDSQAPFNDAKKNMADMEKEASNAACTQLLQVCSRSNVWVPIGSGSQEVFYCDLTDATTCVDVATVGVVIDSMYVKPTVPPEMACGAEAAAQGTPCDLELCSTNCTRAEARDASMMAVTNLAIARRVLNVYNTILLPWMSCEALLEHIIGMGLSGVFGTIRDGTLLLQNGSLILAAGLVFEVLVCLLGQKRFINKWALINKVGDGGEMGGEMEMNNKMSSGQPQKTAAGSPMTTGDQTVVYVGQPSYAAAEPKHGEATYGGALDMPNAPAGPLI